MKNIRIFFICNFFFFFFLVVKFSIYLNRRVFVMVANRIALICVLCSVMISNTACDLSALLAQVWQSKYLG